MANELKHKDIGDDLTKVEFELVDLHQLDSQATGDLIKAVSDTQLSRLPIGANDKVLTVVGGVPAWADPPAATQAEDVLGTALSGIGGLTTISFGYRNQQIAGGDDYDLVSLVQTYDANSMAVAVFTLTLAGGAAGNKIGLYMDNVLVAESAGLSAGHFRLIGTKALSGSKTCKASIHNYESYEQNAGFIGTGSAGGSPMSAAIGVGSIKVA